MKLHHRLDIARLAEVLHERNLANVDAIRELLQHSREGGMPFCEALVATNLVTDWNLSKLVAETFNLPFLPVDFVEPNPAARRDLDTQLFVQHQLVPIDRFGQALTVAMPGLVPAEVLALVSAACDLVILPIVGTVETNRRWIMEHLGRAGSAEIEGGWGNLFDQADAEVNASLGDEATGAFAEALGMPEAPSLGAAATVGGEASLSIEAIDEDMQFDLTSATLPMREDESIDLGNFGAAGVLDALDALDVEPEPDEEAPPATGNGLDLPPMPDFGRGRQAG